MSFSGIWGLIRQTISEWLEDNVSRLAAALAYYTIFAIAPTLVVAIAIAGFVFGREAAQKQVYDQVSQTIGPGAALALQMMVENASRTGAGLWATIIGIVLLLYGATNAFASLQDSLNTIWEVKADPNRSWWAVIKDRFLSLAVVLGIGFLLMVSLLLSAALSGAIAFLGGGSGVWWQVLNNLAFIPVATLLFAMMYKLLPDVRITWREVWIGALTTAILFDVGKWLIGLYLGRGSITSVYGAAGSLVVILIWIYYSAQILFLGAEFTQVWASRYGRRIKAAANAVPLSDRQREEQGIPRREQLEQRAARRHGGAGPIGAGPIGAGPTVRSSDGSANRLAHRRRRGRTSIAAATAGASGVLIGSAVGVWLGMRQHGAAVPLRGLLRRRSSSRADAMLEQRIDEVTGEVRRARAALDHCANGQPGVRTLWQSIQQAFGASGIGHIRRSSRLARAIGRWVHAQ